MLPRILQLRDETENVRRIPRPIIDALLAGQFGRLTIARELAGLELPTAEVLAVYEMLAGAEASVAWIVWNNSLPCLFSRFLAPDARAEIFGNDAWLHASSTRPSGRAALTAEGYRVTGRWSLVSGCELAEWLALRCVVEENGQPRMLQPGIPEVRFMFLRRGEFEILDTWYTGGLRGTGSHDVVVKDRMVARRHSLSPADGCSLNAVVARIPIVCTLAAGYAAQVLGIGQAAVDALMALTRSKVGTDPGPALGERPAVLACIVRHRAALAAARDHLHACVTRQWQTAAAGQGADPQGIIATWGAAQHTIDAGKAAVEAMYSAAGASSIYTSSPLERAHRDLHAMAAHVIAQPMWIEDAGRVLLGGRPNNPLFAL